MNHRTQPYTHCVEVAIKRYNKIYRFLLFFKRHVHLRLNKSTRELEEGGTRGDVLVVAMGPKVGARGMGGRETRVADRVIER